MVSQKWCDRCHKKTDEYREQDGEVLCEQCIRELEKAAGMREYSIPVTVTSLASYDVHAAAIAVVAEVENAALDAAYAARAEEMALQAAWEEFMSVPSYWLRFKEGRESFEGPRYGTCGHLSRNENDLCPACRARWF